MIPLKFETFNSFKRLRKKMNIVKTKEEVLLKHPNVINYLNRYNSIKNGDFVCYNEDFSNMTNKIITLDSGLIVDKITNQCMVLYIFDQQAIYNEENESNYKFHISFCKTVDEYIYKKNRWSALKKDNDIFEIRETDINRNHKIVNKKMKVCRNCLERINYKNFNHLSREEKENVINNFSLKEFFSIYENNFMYIPDYLKREYQDFNEEYATSYTDDWKEISRRFREYKHWICDKCGKDMSNDKYNLHVHHRDHNKQNNNPANFMCLCRDCHAKMPGHSHMNK